MFLSPSEIINSNFYRRGPIDYLTKDPYDHIFLEVTKQGEKYTPPPSESGVVNLSNCSICSIPEMCLLFLANVRRIQPPRACKQAEIGADRQLNEAGDDARKQRSNDILKSEIQACEINRVNEKMEQNLDHANYNHIHYLDKTNLLTRDPYILPETAFIDETFYNTLTMKSGTVASLMRKFINIVKAFVIFSRKNRDELTNSDPLMMKNLLEKEAWRLILLNTIHLRS